MKDIIKMYEKNTSKIEDLNLDGNYSIIEKQWNVSISKWNIHYLNTLNDLETLQEKTKNKIIFITPFCLAWVEQWYDVIWSEKIIALEVKEEITLTKTEILGLLPDIEINFKDIKTDISDENFWKLVIETKEKISDWEVNQLIVSREFYSNIELSNKELLSIFRKLLLNKWQYMTFLFDTPDLSFVWASPEKHLSINENKIIMNPISGTIPKLDKEDFYKRFIKFLNDDKEIWELSMVIDEELKMISKITDWWIIEVPLLKEVWAVVHTEANLNWVKKKNISVLDAFRETMYAPTLVWWPLESAFTQIAWLEKNSREYYWSAFWIYDKDFLDTAITIRTAFIDKKNQILKVRAWAWIVKDSNPEKEAKETIAKSEWFFWSIKKWITSNKEEYLKWLNNEQKNNIEKILEKRRWKLSKFYLNSHNNENLEVDEIKGKNFILINNWDDFVNLSWYMIEKMWGNIDIVSNKDFDLSIMDNYDLVLIWPWYWNINDESDKKMINLLGITEKLIDSEKKILWICLWHQAICKVKWFEIEKQKEIIQWEQKEVEFNWRKEILWFYNSFSPVINWDNNWIDIFEDNRILNYREENIYSTQSHPESIMSINWFNILKDMILDLIEEKWKN